MSQNGKASREFLRVASLPSRELETLVVRGEPPSLEAIVGWEYRGMNTPQWAKFVGIKKFVKGFYKAGTEAYGYNEPVVQGRQDAPWRAKPTDDSPRRFGFFWVGSPDPTSRDNAYLNSILLDYARGKGFPIDPTKTLRDYVVRVEKGSDDILLGKAFVAVGPARVPVSYFVLERHRPTEFRG